MAQDRTNAYSDAAERIEVELTKLLDRKGLRLFVVATGAGAGIQQMIWSVPGCSAFLVGAEFPYAPELSATFAGLTPEKFASEEFAIDLAAAAYMRALDANDPTSEAVGLAVTASVAGLKPHRGDHRIHICVMTKDRVLGQSLVLDKTAFGGAGKDARMADGLITDWEALMTFIAAVTPGHEWEERVEDFSERARARFFKHPYFHGGKRFKLLHGSRPVVGGAFNPAQFGHESIADAVEKHTGEEPVFTVCTTSVHKVPIGIQEMLRRAKVLPHRTVWFTEGDPLYIDKARKSPNTPIVFGADALVRMLDPKWGPVPAEMLAEFEGLGTTFYVFGRKINDVFVSAEEAIGQVPEVFRKLFTAIEGRWDISSSEVRAKAAIGSTPPDPGGPVHVHPETGIIMPPGTEKANGARHA